jgi:hypothetical protein
VHTTGYERVLTIVCFNMVKNLGVLAEIGYASRSTL